MPADHSFGCIQNGSCIFVTPSWSAALVCVLGLVNASSGFTSRQTHLLECLLRHLGVIFEAGVR